MQTVWKYGFRFEDLSTDGYISFDMPKDAIPLSFQLQHRDYALWVHVLDTEAPKETRRFKFVNTGEPLFDSDLSYVGTVQRAVFVFHLFEVLD